MATRAQATGFILTAILIAIVAGYLLIGTQTGFKSEGQAITQDGGSMKQCCRCNYEYGASSDSLFTQRLFTGKTCTTSKDCATCKSTAEMTLVNPNIGPLLILNGPFCAGTAPCPDQVTPQKKVCKCTYRCDMGPFPVQYRVDTANCGISGFPCTGSTKACPNTFKDRGIICRHVGATYSGKAC